MAYTGLHACMLEQSATFAIVFSSFSSSLASLTRRFCAAQYEEVTSWQLRQTQRCVKRAAERAFFASSVSWSWYSSSSNLSWFEMPRMLLSRFWLTSSLHTGCQADRVVFVLFNRR